MGNPGLVASPLALADALWRKWVFLSLDIDRLAHYIASALPNLPCSQPTPLQMPDSAPDPGRQVPAGLEGFGSGIVATRALASTGPTPGTSISRRPTSVALGTFDGRAGSR